MIQIKARLALAPNLRAHHPAGRPLCDECRQLHEYAMARLDRCPFGAGKTTCARCTVHCYKPQMRERIGAAMRYAGPRMLLRHPILALLHQWDSWRCKS